MSEVQRHLYMNCIIQIALREPAFISISVNMKLVNEFTLLSNYWAVYKDKQNLCQYLASDSVNIILYNLI